ncbi:MAG: hypothetical protein HY063_02715 [Bacteroidetes bacterium]|nr:hypothetical protein [Bacteroidota bacterium]
MDITPYLNRLDILNETAQQIIKDFGMAGMEIKFSGKIENAYEELFSQILPLVEKLHEENFQNFYNLMYRIDISETQIKKAMESSLDKKFSEVVTDLILKREIQKVITRKSFL